MSKSNLIFILIVSGCKLLRNENGVKVDNTLYEKVVGRLMYLTTTRPYLMFMVNLISRYMSSPTELHIQAVKRILRYLRETINFEVFYKMRGNRDLLVYMNNDYTRDQDDKKKKHFRLCFLIKFRGNIMVIKEVADCNYIYYRGRLHCYSLLCMSGSMVEKDSEDAW